MLYIYIYKLIIIAYAQSPCSSHAGLLLQVARFRRELETASGERDVLSAELGVKRQLLAAAEQELTAIDVHSRQRLSVLRWRNAAALVGTRCQQTTVQSGAYEGERPPCWCTIRCWPATLAP